jgi:hypothetical protein
MALCVGIGICLAGPAGVLFAQRGQMPLGPPPVKTCVVWGSVKGADDAPVENARVTVCQWNDKWVKLGCTPAVTDSKGEYRVQGVPAIEKLHLIVLPPAGVPLGQMTEEPVAFTGEPEIRVDAKLTPVALLKLTLLDAGKKPVKGLTLGYAVTLLAKAQEFVAREKLTEPSDARGVVTVRAHLQPAGEPSAVDKCTARLKRWEGDLVPVPEVVEIKLEPGAVVEKTVVLQPGGEVTGKIVDDLGIPLENMLVRLAFTNNVRQATTNLPLTIPHPDFEVTTDDGGRFILKYLPERDYYLAVAQKPDDGRKFWIQSYQPVTVSRTKSPDMNLAVTRSGGVEGWVYSPMGQRLAATIQVKPAGGGAEPPRAPATGCDPRTRTMYMVAPLAPGSYRLEVLLSDEAMRTKYQNLIQETIVEVPPGKTARCDVRIRE